MLVQNLYSILLQSPGASATPSNIQLNISTTNMTTGYHGFKQGYYESDQRWTDVDEYTSSHLHNNAAVNLAAEYALKNSDDNNLPSISVSSHQGKFLSLLARSTNAKNILEVGLLGGYSTIWLASASPAVKITTIEYSAKHAEVARKNFEHAGIADRVEIIVGSGTDVLPKLVEEVKAGKRPTYDFFFIDADKENNWTYVDCAANMARSNALIVVDNVVRRGSLAHQQSDDSRIRGNRKMVENVGKDARLDATVTQLVGDKSYDGWLIATVH